MISSSALIQTVLSEQMVENIPKTLLEKKPFNASKCASVKRVGHISDAWRGRISLGKARSTSFQGFLMAFSYSPAYERQPPYPKKGKVGSFNASCPVSSIKIISERWGQNTLPPPSRPKLTPLTMIPLDTF